MNLLYPLSIAIVAAASYLLGKHGQRFHRDFEVIDAHFHNRRLIEKNAKLCQMLVENRRLSRRGWKPPAESSTETQEQFRNRIRFERKRPL